MHGTSIFSDPCGITFFHDKRPENVKLINDLPHNMCMCSYHANFIDAVTALRKIVPSLPEYKNGFIEHFLCDNPTEYCWFGRCKDCTGISITKLNESFSGIPLNSPGKWTEWKKNDATKRIEKREKSGTLAELAAHIAALSTPFLRHSFIKCEQSEVFNKIDRPRASSAEFPDEGLLQIDFAENFVCVSQDEVQSAHWNQRQITLFTSAMYHNETVQSKVYVSDSPDHTKKTIIPYLYKLLTDMPTTLKVLKIWSDGPSSQFKNKFMAAMIPRFETEFGLKIYWNYFVTSHGKGCVDGIGATAKTIVRKHINARDLLVNSASDFVAAFHRTPSKISVEEFTEDDFADTNNLLNANGIFEQAKNVNNIASAHQIQVINKKIVIFDTSKIGYK